jgi:hypothetical protein
MSAPRPGESRGVPPLVTLAIASTIAGISICLLLLVRETPYTLTAFMFLGQPLLAAGFVFYAWNVILDLKRKELL